MGTKDENEIKLKQVGNNLIVVIDGKQMTKVEKDKAEREKIINKVKLYNKKNSEARKKELIKIFDKKIVRKEELTAKAKGKKKIVRKEERTNEAKKKLIDDLATIKKGELSTGDIKAGINKLQALLDKNKKVDAAAPKAQTSPVRRSGEH